MSNEIKRMKYFNGLLLKEDDLALEQEYHIKLQRLHNRFFHDWGVVDGLAVNPVGGYPKVTVSQGLALNRIAKDDTNEKFSQEIWISDSHPDNPVDLSEYDVNKDIYITLIYEEAAADKDSKKGGDKEIHIWERGRIKHSSKLPEDPSKEIVLARVRLIPVTSGGKVVGEVSEKEADGITQVRKYAVTQGTAQEFAKIYIGEKDKLNLPSIGGLVDKTLGQNDGLEIRSPYTKFSGKVISGDLKTNGNVSVNGSLSVNANNSEVFKIDSSGTVNIAKNAAVTGTLSTAGGLNVSGENTTLNTTNVVMTGNMLTVNKYTPKQDETEPRMQSSGVEVFRGGYTPNAKLLWDEARGTWRAGTDAGGDGAESGIYDIAYGPDWEKVHDGSNADLLHKHSTISGKDNKPILTADDKGNVNIQNKIVVFGSVVAKSGIEVPSENDSAKLVWNETDKRWQIGLGADMYNIPYGKSWQDLTTGTNADMLHNHSEFYNSDRNLVMGATPTGDVKVYSDLSVAKNLIVEGELIALKGKEFQEIEQVVTKNVILVNKPDNNQPSAFEGGLEVYRGEELPNARLIWDEGSDSWKIGTGSNMSVIPSGIELEYLTHGENADQLHKHGSLIDEEGTEVVDVDSEGNVKIASDLAVAGDIAIQNNASVKGDVSLEGSVVIKGDLQVEGTKTIKNVKTIEVDDHVILVNRYTGQSQPENNEGGLAVYRGGDDINAKIVWNESEKKWKVGTGDNMQELPYGDKWDTLTKKASADLLHTHSVISDKKGAPVINVNSNGDLSINKNTKVTGTLAVSGPMTIAGDLEVLGNLSSVDNVIKKIDSEVEGNTLILNKFTGETPPLNESGIEIFRGEAKPKARMIWDEAAGIWKMGLGDELKEVPSGKSWDKLTAQKNADSLHSHGQIYNEKGDILALSTRVSGNIDIAHDLTIGQDLAVLGNLEVKGGLTRISSSNIEVIGNSITMNRFDSGALKKVDSTISVYRGVAENSAILAWDEANGNWKIGMSNSPQVLRINQDGSIHSTAANIDGEINAGSAYINGSLTVKDGILIDRGEEPKPVIKWITDTNQWVIGIGQEGFICTDSTGKVGIGNQAPQERLDVSGNAVVSGNMDVKGNSNVTGSLTAASAEITGTLKVKGGFSLNNGIEVDRGSEDGIIREPAKIVWKEDKQKWYFGVGDNLSEIILNNYHKHSELYSRDEGTISVLSDKFGNVCIGTQEPKAKLDVSGDTIINGKITVKNTVETSGSALFGGKVTARDCFEIYRGDEAEVARLYWNEDSDTWQAGTERDLKNISLSGHTHNSLYSGSSAIVNVDGSGNVAIGKTAADAKLDVNGNIRATGMAASGSITAEGTLKGADADISGVIKAGNGTITNNLTVGGNLTVNGELVTVNTTNLDVEDNIITINKYAPQKDPADKNAGIEVFRGGTAPNAQLIWNEKDLVWQAGTTADMKTLGFRDHQHDELTAITGAMSVKDNKIGMGTASPAEKLDVVGNAKISAKVTAGEFYSTGKISAGEFYTGGKASAGEFYTIGKISGGEAAISGILGTATLNAGNVNVSGALNVGSGIELTRSGIEKKAQINWNESNKMWQAGIDGDMKDISLSGHTHTEITSITGVMTVKGGNIGIGSTNPLKKLEVTGDTGISGKLTAASADISGALSAGSLTAGSLNSTTLTAASLTATNLTVNSGKLIAAATDITGILTLGQGIETSDTVKGKISWDSTNKRWLAGTSDDLKPVEFSGHKHPILYSDTGAEAIIISSAGSVGIGKTPDEGVKLDIDGIVQASNITATNVTQTSSAVFKENIEELPVKTALELLKQLNPVTFDYKNNYLKKHNIGFIAEEVPGIFTTTDCKSISIMDIVAVLTAVVKKQQTESTAMKKQINILQKQVAGLIGA